MRKSPTQLLLGEFAAPSKDPAPAHRRLQNVDPPRSRRTVELCNHLLDRLDLVAMQQRLREESLAELYAAVERHFDASAPSGEVELAEFERYDAFAPGPDGQSAEKRPSRLSWRRTG